MPDADEQKELLNENQEEGIDTANVSPEERRRQYNQQEGREVDSFPLPSDDGDDADDESDREP